MLTFVKELQHKFMKQVRKTTSVNVFLIWFWNYFAEDKDKGTDV